MKDVSERHGVKEKPPYTKLKNVEILLVFLLLVFASLMIALPNFLRESNLLIGGEAYHYMRLAETPLNIHDNLSYAGRTIIFNLYPSIIYLFSHVFGFTYFLSSKMLPFVLGLVSVLLFYIILRKLKLRVRDSLIVGLILIFSPTFIYLFSTSNLYVFPVVFGLIAFLLLLYDKKILSLIFILLSFFFSIVPGIALLLLYLLYLFRESKTRWFIIPIIILVSIVLYLIKGIFPFGLEFFIQQEGIRYSMQNFVSDLGGKFGLGIFAIILSVLGMIRLWREKYNNLIVYSAVFLLLILSFFEIRTLFYFIFMFSFLVASGIFYLFELNFESKFIKQFSIFVLIMGLFFSGLSYVNEIRTYLPNEGMLKGLDDFESLSDPEVIVFSHYSRGFWISGLANRAVVMDADFIFAPDSKERYKDSETLFNTRDLNAAMKLLDKYNVDYILFDQAIKETLWEGDEEGLLFLLKYSERFKKVYNDNGLEVWKVIRE
ncbi:MAG: hypothetical protein PHG05_00215 [Candidatus Nanoarchaeia archaeon]|nr:hypothetical protein [Candidatus Nanoarchaeia archaeon]